MQTIIGITGSKQSGKTTSFNFAKEIFPTLQEIQLANRLKDECAIELHVPREYFDLPEFKEKELILPIILTEYNVFKLIESFGLDEVADFDAHIQPHIGKVFTTPRQVAQYVGTEILRAINPDVHCLGALIDLPKHGAFVVTDIRFVNEYDFFADKYQENFFPFYISNQRAEVIAAKDNHASEKEVLEVAKRCAVIDNNGNLDELQLRVSTIFSGILDFLNLTK